MFDTPVINVAIGLVFCFAATALAASTLTEALASLVKLRANSLLTGVEQMLNDPKFNGLAQEVYNHALVHPQGDGAMHEKSRFWTYSGPSYIRAANFATALVHVLQKVPGDAAQLKASIDALPGERLKQLLSGMLVRAKGDVEQLQQHIANWFDTAMDRVCGAYKRKGAADQLPRCAAAGGDDQRRRDPRGERAVGQPGAGAQPGRQGHRHRCVDHAGRCVEAAHHAAGRPGPAEGLRRQDRTVLRLRARRQRLQPARLADHRGGCGIWRAVLVRPAGSAGTAARRRAQARCRGRPLCQCRHATSPVTSATSAPSSAITQRMSQPAASSHA